MLELLSGILVGIMQVGSSTSRTVEVMRGKPFNVLMASLVISVAFYFSVSFVIANNFLGYIGFSIGAAFATTLLAYRRQLKKREKREQKEQA
jgi:hypothetical protein